MGFKMKKPSMTQGTKGHREAIKNIKLNRNMDNTSLPDGRAGSSAFQKTGSPMKALDDRIARTEAKTAKLQGKKEAKIIKGKAKAQAKADKLTQRAEVKEAKAGVKEAKGKYKKRGRKIVKAEKLRAKAAAYTPPSDKKTTPETTPDTAPDTAPETKKKASLTTGAYKEKSTARAKSVGKEKLPTYKSAYDKVKDKYKDKGGYKQFITDAEKYWKDKESSPAKNYKNPQDYKVFNYGNKPTPVKHAGPEGMERHMHPHGPISLTSAPTEEKTWDQPKEREYKTFEEYKKAREERIKKSKLENQFKRKATWKKPK